MGRPPLEPSNAERPVLDAVSRAAEAKRKAEADYSAAITAAKDMGISPSLTARAAGVDRASMVNLYKWRDR